MLRRHRATRRQAFGLAGGDLAMRLDPQAGSEALRLASAQAVPVMVFVGNRSASRSIPARWTGCSTYQAGSMCSTRTSTCICARPASRPPGAVVKPTADGAVTSIELLDADGEVIALLFGARKPGQAEREDWRAIASTVAERHAFLAESAA
jgi:putative hemin transport protein